MIDGDPPKAVLFDLDGTLYELETVLSRMGRALAINAVLSPLKGPRTIKVLKAFRAVREELRAVGDGSPSLDEAQYAEPARQLGVDPELVRAAVADWMLERPLPHLLAAGRTALRPILAALKGWELPIGVFSDYPADAKLAALGVDDMVDVTVCATEPEVNALKPHPRGFLVAAERMGVPPEEVVYVGDRVDVDAAGAAAAGMRCLIVGAPVSGPHHVAVETFEEIPNVLGLG
ncbi:MAG: HAD family hydrolase [Planctomycetota bacterium]|nr:HAD family hydrolase [Planctomycetota bacterium]